MSNFCLIRSCEINRARFYLNFDDSELMTKMSNVHRDNRSYKKLELVLAAIRLKTANRTQYNFEANLACGKVYAIKVDEHRFYTLEKTSEGYRDYYITKYGRKQSDKNTKKLTDIIDSIDNITIEITKWIT